MNATRFPLQPLPQPVYRFSDIPSAARNLEGSTLHRVTDRLVWQQCLGEMVLLCKEAASRWNRKRQAQPADCGAHKPLSLEYLADRSDVDEPLWGYMVRDKEQGRLQGFVTVTTFTNYHRHFRWDSQHPAAFYDEDDVQEGEQAEEGTHKKKKHPQNSTSCRTVDTNGRLAAELQATCRAGDIWQEGIVWPRIAEISLLGALGCGQVLIDLVLEDLARLKATASAHYDYVVLQATDNSITFYENRGFIRVGALSTEMVSSSTTASAWGSPRRHRRGTKQDAAAADDGNDHLVVDWGSPSKQNKDEELSDWIVAPAWDMYKTKKVGETPLKIAQALRVNAHDICFLNQREYPELQVSSRLKADTVLTVPKVVAPENSRARPSVEMEWFTAKENDTPRSIAKMTGVPCAQIVAANKARLPGLVSSARLKQGTKVRIVKQDDGGCCWQAYSHWAFPDDDSFEAGEPSYMMAIKLDKPARGKTSHRPILDSLASEITPFEKPALLLDVAGSSATAASTIGTVALHSTPLPASLPPLTTIASATTTTKTPAIAESPQAPPVQDSLVSETIPPPPVPPKKPQGSWIIYCHEMRERKAALLKGKNASETTRIFKDAYDLLTDADKQIYTKKAARQKQAYLPLKAAYDKELAAYQAKYPQAVVHVQQSTTPSSKTHSSSKRTSDLFDHRSTDFFNKVVRLRPGAPAADGTPLDKYTYWYVLTFIPDLQWCHLGPMRAVGTFGSDKPKAEGRPRYKLEDESLGLEVDISSTYCIPVKSRGMRNTNDADKEEWDIRDDGTEPGSMSGSRRCSLESNVSVASSFRSATKPSAVIKDRKRKRPVESSASSSTSSSLQQLPALEAVHPDTQRVMRVIVRQRGPGRPPKAPKILRETTAVGPVVAPPQRSSSHSSSTTTQTIEEDSALSEDNDNVKDNDELTSSSLAQPKRLAAPTFLAESPGSPQLRQRQQPARGKQPIMY